MTHEELEWPDPTLSNNSHDVTNQFSEWRTRLDEGAALVPHLKKLSLKERLRLDSQLITAMINNDELAPDAAMSELLRLGEEYLWIRAGKPYYKVHPKIVSHLCRCDLKTLPSDYLEAPGGFDAVLVRFSSPSPDLTVSGDEYVRSVLFCRSLLDLSRDDFADLLERGQRPAALDLPPSVLTLHIDLGERGASEGMSYIRDWTICLRRSRDKSLGEEFAFSEASAPDLIAPGTRRREVLANCLRLIATVGLIANSPDENLLEYDVLSKDRQEFATASEERRITLIERAKRRGKLGWNVGTNELFLGEMPPGSNGAKGGSGRERTHAHIRTGHLHAVRCGPGRRGVKVKWFRPTVVRPDLPFLGA